MTKKKRDIVDIIGDLQDFDDGALEKQQEKDLKHLKEGIDNLCIDPKCLYERVNWKKKK